MCEVCKSEGHNYLFKNGPKKSIYNSVLYRVFKHSTASIRLCHVHSIELFTLGERRFLLDHILFSRSLAQKTVKAKSESDSSPFGFF